MSDALLKGQARQKAVLAALKSVGKAVQVKESEGVLRDEALSGLFSELVMFADESEAYRKRLLLRVSVAALVSACASIFVLSAAPLLLALFVYLFETRRLERKARARALSFEEDYTAFLITLSSSVKAGRDPLSALLEAEAMFSKESELSKQLLKLRRAIEKQVSESDAVLSFAESVDNPDISLFRLAFLLARREGSALSVCLERLAKVTRQRQSFRRKVKGAVALQRVSSYGICTVALVALVFQIATNLPNVKIALSSPLGVGAFSLGGLLIASGLYWMSKVAPRRY